MDLDLFDPEKTCRLQELSGDAVTEVYSLPNGHVVALIKTPPTAQIIHSVVGDIEQMQGDLFEYDSIWAAAFALVNWEPSRRPQPSGFKSWTPNFTASIARGLTDGDRSNS